MSPGNVPVKKKGKNAIGPDGNAGKMKIADVILMERYKNGDVKAFSELMERHRRPIFNYCFRFVFNYETAADLTQDVFMRVVKSAHGYEQRAKFTTWLYTIARNLCVDFSRKAKHRKTTSLNTSFQSKGTDNRTLLDKIPSDKPTPESGTHSSKLGKAIEKAIMTLPDDQREVFLLREYSGIRFKEISKIVNAPENTVKSRMRYALSSLREILSTQGFTP